jgi:hypothetical protein
MRTTHEQRLLEERIANKVVGKLQPELRVQVAEMMGAIRMEIRSEMAARREEIDRQKRERHEQRQHATSREAVRLSRLSLMVAVGALLLSADSKFRETPTHVVREIVRESPPLVCTPDDVRPEPEPKKVLPPVSPPPRVKAKTIEVPKTPPIPVPDRVPSPAPSAVPPIDPLRQAEAWRREKPIVGQQFPRKGPPVSTYAGNH